jgi:hypothetical protein
MYAMQELLLHVSEDCSRKDIPFFWKFHHSLVSVRYFGCGETIFSESVQELTALGVIF